MVLCASRFTTSDENGDFFMDNDDYL